MLLLLNVSPIIFLGAPPPESAQGLCDYGSAAAVLEDAELTRLSINSFREADGEVVDEWQQSWNPCGEAVVQLQQPFLRDQRAIAVGIPTRQRTLCSAQ